MIDRSKYMHMRFMYYRYGDRLVEIAPNEFPKQLAIQNRWAMRDDMFLKYDMPFMKYPIDPYNEKFRESITAKMWANLDIGRSLEEMDCEEVEFTILQHHYTKYIKQQRDFPEPDPQKSSPMKEIHSTPHGRGKFTDDPLMKTQAK